MRRRSRFRASTLLLAAVLSATPAFARGHQPTPTMVAQGFFSTLWQALGGLFPVLTKGRDTIDPNGALTDGRGTIDPDGATSTASAGSETDGRAGQDPNG
ncbi:MAG TPA: hypothetical protein VGM86_29390 [Thermoanaerobaculia bacterium]|jgi:hypothetical protein